MFSILIFPMGIVLPVGKTYSSLCFSGFAYVNLLLLYFCGQLMSPFLWIYPFISYINIFNKV